MRIVASSTATSARSSASDRSPAGIVIVLTWTHPLQPITTAIVAVVVLGDSTQVSALPHRVLLPVEVLPILNVVDLGDEFLLDRVARMQAVERLADHELEIVIGLLDLTDVDRLKLSLHKKRIG